MEAESDHRSRTAKARREQMRRRLIESAILVFAEQGVNSAVIGQVTRQPAFRAAAFTIIFVPMMISAMLSARTLRMSWWPTPKSLLRVVQRPMPPWRSG